MWEFIKYCLRCCAMVIAASAGNNPPGMNFKNVIIGLLTLNALIWLGILILYVTGKIVNYFKGRHKQNKI